MALLIGLLASLIITSLCNKNGEPLKPNFVLIVADDLGWDDVGYHGSPEVKTPNIDKLASEGVILNDYYVQPICTPTRSALMTGRYPIRNGMQSSVIMTSQPWGLGLEEKLLPEKLRDLKYKTHLVGKWHLGFFSKPYLPMRRGFDTHFGSYAGRGDFWDHSSECGTFNGLDLRDGEKAVLNEWGNYTTEMFTDVAISRIMDHDEKHPLFLMLSHLAVHSANSKAPLQAPDEEMKMFDDVKHPQRKAYLAMVASLDKSVGRIYDALKDAGILDNTIIMFTTDNGAASNGFDSNHGSNFPFRGMKTSLFEGGIRAAGFVNSPLIKKKGRVSNQLLHITDWYATILALAGGEPDGKIDGQNIWDHLSHNQISPRKELLLNIDPTVYQNSALRLGKWKLVFQEPDEWTEYFNPPDYERAEYQSASSPLKSSVKCGEKPAEPPNCTNGCLFNMRADPCEYKDLSETKGELFEALKEKLEQYKTQMVEPRYKHDEDPNANPRNHGGIWSPWVDSTGDPVAHKPLAPEASLPGQPNQNKEPAEETSTTPQPAVTVPPPPPPPPPPPQQAMHHQQQQQVVWPQHQLQPNVAGVFKAHRGGYSDEINSKLDELANDDQQSYTYEKDDNGQFADQHDGPYQDRNEQVEDVTSKIINDGDDNDNGIEAMVDLDKNEDNNEFVNQRFEDISLLY